MQGIFVPAGIDVANMKKDGADVVSAMKASGKAVSEEAGKMDDSLRKAAKGTKSLAQESRAATKDALVLAKAFGTESKEAIEAAKAAAHLADEVGDFKALIKGLEPGGAFKTFGQAASQSIQVVNGVTAAMSLIGVEGKKAEEAIKTMMALSAVSAGIQAIIELKDTYAILSTVIKLKVVPSIAAMNTALLLSAVGGVALLIASIVMLTETMAEDAESAERLKKKFAEIEGNAKAYHDAVKEARDANMKTRDLEIRNLTNNTAKQLALSDQAKQREINAVKDTFNASNQTIHDHRRKVAQLLQIEIFYAAEAKRIRDEAARAERDSNLAVRDLILRAMTEGFNKEILLLQQARQREINAANDTFDLSSKTVEDKKRKTDSLIAIEKYYSAEIAKIQTAAAERQRLIDASRNFTFIAKIDNTLVADHMLDQIQKDITRRWKDGIPVLVKIQPEVFLKMPTHLNEQNENLVNLIKTAAVDSIANLSASLGEAIVNGQNIFQAAGASILDSMGQFMVSLGREILFIGLGLETLATLLKNPLTAGPAAISIGVLLIGAGAALSAIAKRTQQSMGGGGGGSDSDSGNRTTGYAGGGLRPMANGAIAYGPTPALVGEYAGARTNPEVIAPLSDLTKILMNVGVTGGGKLVGRLQGRDILISAQQAQNKRNR
jgi:hypothetical protein